ncbi:TRAP transporter permease [Reyranella sp.]|uniref:TRAP transporter large permease n=1 Tax=Reyranella sp. TaxID=1929291 RepID=UPI0025E132DF|nr:TRAP transporter permease [Reyranella sp.]
MSPDTIAVAGFVALFALMMLRVPVGMAMGLVGVTGYAYLTGGAPALKLVGQTSMRTVTSYQFGVIPMFLLMGAFVSASGVSRELFRAANTFVGHRKGGLGLATIVSCGAFAAISGSSVATAATFSTVAYPEMRRYGYPQSFSTGVIAAGGTLGAMLPPSTVLAVYGLITQQDIGKLFQAGILPGLLAMAMYMVTIAIICRVKPDLLPTVPKASWEDRLAGLKDVWAPVLLFVLVIGGLYGGVFTPTEAGGVGASGAFLLGVLRRRLDGKAIRASLLQATRTAAAVFTVLIGALLFGYFLTITQVPQKVTEFLTGLGIGPYGVLALIMLMYLVLGCLMDAMAMIILTVPIIFPVVTQLGFDPVWFGVIIVMTVELGLIHPPVGMNVFVIKSVVQDVTFSSIFKGVLPFIATDILRLIILIAFPIIALWLPSRL